MEGEFILTTPSQLKLLLVEAVSIALKYHQPSLPSPSSTRSTKVDFQAVMSEYYPGIPESTVRQDTAQLGRTKVGKRILLDRAEIEEHLRLKRQLTGSELAHQVDADFIRQHKSRKGGVTA